MSQKQLKTLKVIQQYIDKAITRERAAELLSLSPRQITRLKKGVMESGAGSLIHKNTGRKPVHAISDEMKENILKIHSQPEFENVNFPHFKEILYEDHDIEISYTALTSILKGAGIKSPKKKKTHKRKHRRKRKACRGELLQIDATPHEWFGGNTKYALHGAIDDASGDVVGLYMTRNECLFGYLEMMRQCCLDFGVPQTVYSDKHTIFRSPKTGLLSVEQEIAGEKVNLTQFGRAMDELGIDIIYANSAQAKGRVERLWDTLQSRLPVEFAKRGINTIEAANEFLKSYRFTFNEKFSVETQGASLFVQLAENVDIDDILCIKKTRKTDNAGVFSFKGRCFQILDAGFPVISKGTAVSVLMNPRTGIRVEYKGKVYETIRYLKPDHSETDVKPTPKKIPKTVMPHLKHSSEEWKKIWWYEDFNQSLKFLYELFFKEQQSAA